MFKIDNGDLKKIITDNSILLNRWGIKGGLAILDQGVYSGSNFIFNVLLARWLSADNYGAFSLAFAVYLFFTSFHNAMILEPMSVFGTAKYSENIQSYLTSQFIIHFFVTSILGIFLSLVGYSLLSFSWADPFISNAIIGVGIFLPFMLVMWLARRTFYILSEPGWAFFLSCVYSIFLLGGAFFLHSIKNESVIAWFGVIGVSSLTGFITLFRLDVVSGVSEKNKLEWKKLLVEQWVFGKWIVLAAFFYFAATQIQIFISAGVLGLEAAGAFRALQNFMLPMMQVLTAISTLVMPSIAFAFGQKNYINMRKKSFVVAGVLFIFSAFYLCFLFFFAASLENLLYAGKYREYVGLIPAIGIIPLLTALEIGFSMIVRSLQRSIYHAILTLGMAFTGVVSGLLLVPLFGIAGAITSLVSSSIISFIINIYFYRKWFSGQYKL